MFRERITMGENKSVNELNEAIKGIWESLTEEQKEKAKQCKSTDELTALAGQMGVELPDEILDVVAGGRRYGLTYGGDAPTTAKAYCPYCKEVHTVKRADIPNYHLCERNQRLFRYDYQRAAYVDGNMASLGPGPNPPVTEAC